MNNTTYNISLRSSQIDNNEENTVSNESNYENKRNKIVKISTLYKELDYISNKFSDQNNENEENEILSKHLFPNNILISSNQEKITLDKEKLLNYEHQIKRLDLISLLSYENFSQFFDFLPPITKVIESFYGIDFKDQSFNNSDLGIFANVKESSINNNSFLFELEQLKFQKRKNLSFGEDPINLFNKISTNQNMSKNRKEKEIQNLENCKNQCFNFVCKEENIIKTPRPILKKKEESLKIEKMKKESKKNEKGLFQCEICSLAFDNPQGLGGHMSGVHRDASLKYKKKRETRNKRFEIRKMNNLSKKILCLKHKVNYDEMILSKDGKRKIKNLVKQNLREFKKIKIDLQQKRKSEN
jgi:hypothetical protein